MHAWTDGDAVTEKSKKGDRLKAEEVGSREKVHACVLGILRGRYQGGSKSCT